MVVYDIAVSIMHTWRFVPPKRDIKTSRTGLPWNTYAGTEGNRYNNGKGAEDVLEEYEQTMVGVAVWYEYKWPRRREDYHGFSNTK